jgi:formylglycine-generating enzyme required for sulfatase activity/DNA-binding response OmpR family regulator
MARILVVDDSEVDRRVLCGVLGQEPDFSVDVAASGDQALVWLENGGCDLVLTDLVMPGLGGLELVSELAERHPQIPVVIVTSRGSEFTAVEALKRGAASYVPKTLAAKLLRSTIHEVLAITSVERVHNRLMGCIVQNDTRFVLENELILIDSLVEHLLASIRAMQLCDAAGRRCTGVALKEALKNALYHGNLAIDPGLYRSGSYQHEVAAEQRRKVPPYKDRRIHVEASLSQEEGVFTVRDEGRGFDLDAVPDPNDAGSIEESGGRGLVLMAMFADKIIYNEAGNTVTLTKRWGAQPPAEKLGALARAPSDPAPVLASTRPEAQRLACPSCGKILRVAEKSAGRQVPCPACAVPLQVSPDRTRLTVVRASHPSVPGADGRSRTPGATGAAPARQLANSIGMSMVLIPAGEFQMGSPDSLHEAPSYEKPQHPVRVNKPFYLAVYPVTLEQYARVMEQPLSGFDGDPQQPVTMVSWEDAVQFCRRLSALADEEAAGCVYRLPTEAEWEYACRAGGTGKWCFGDDESALEHYAWYEGNSGDTPHPVGRKRPNAWGLHDMHGNVWEWCADWFGEDFYVVSRPDDPIGPNSGDGRVLRGGGWTVGPWGTRSADRSRYDPGLRSPYNGFRVARNA